MTDRQGVNTPLEREQVLAAFIERLNDMTSDWDREDLPGDLADGTLLRAHLGFSSMDLVMLVVDVQSFYQRQDFPWEELFAPLGSYVDDVQVSEIVDFICNHLGSPSLTKEST